ncbi:MAG: hypothetical protein U1E65_18000 [Myxococcota bacterium]
MRGPSVLWLLLALTAGAGPARAAGISARFRPILAREATPIEVEIEVEEQAAVAATAEVEARVGDGDWIKAAAAPTDIEGVFHASVTLSPPPSAGTRVELRARVLGARGGVLLELGYDEPLEVEILSDARWAEAERILTHKVEGEAKLDLIAYLGVEGRLGTSARLRGVVSIGARLSPRQELVLGVAVGPAFSRPPLLEKGGPLVLGAEAAYRVYTVVPTLAGAAPFLDLALSSDFRLPGFDPGIGARIGVSLNLSLDARLDLSLGGAALLYSADTSARSVGFAGGLRTSLRFGSFGEGKGK